MRSVIDVDDHSDTEVTLGMTSLLGIFFGLVLVCGIFFGFGYSMGRRTPSSTAATPAVTPTAAPAVATPSSNSVAQADTPHTPKPSAGQAFDSTADTDADASASDTGQAPADTIEPRAPRVIVRTAPPAPAALRPAPVLTRPAAAPTTATLTTTRQPGTPSAAPASMLSASSGAFMVQIAAVAHKEDADVLAGALHKRGYVVTVRNEPRDTLLHVQIGPFPSRADAIAMKQRLLGDGYNAILKQ